MKLEQVKTNTYPLDISVRGFYNVCMRGINSVGRVSALQAGCQRFESAILHKYLKRYCHGKEDLS